MTIDEAINELRCLYECLKPDTDQKFLEAIPLGIEALAFYSELKRTQGVTLTFRLPGETEE